MVYELPDVDLRRCFDTFTSHLFIYSPSSGSQSPKYIKKPFSLNWFKVGISPALEHAHKSIAPLYLYNIIYGDCAPGAVSKYIILSYMHIHNNFLNI